MESVLNLFNFCPRLDPWLCKRHFSPPVLPLSPIVQIAQSLPSTNWPFPRSLTCLTSPRTGRSPSRSWERSCRGSLPRRCHSPLILSNVIFRLSVCLSQNGGNAGWILNEALYLPLLTCPFLPSSATFHLSHVTFHLSLSQVSYDRRTP